MDIRKIIREEVGDFDWIGDVTPTFYEFWENNLLEEGDILTLRGETLDMDGMPVFLDEAKYQIKKLKRHFLSTMVMFDPETQRKIGVYNATELIDADGELIVLDLQRGGSLEEDPSEPQLYESDELQWIKDIIPPQEPIEPVVGMRFSHNGEINTVTKVFKPGGDFITVTYIDGDGRSANLGSYWWKRHMKDGVITLINESNDFGWVEEIEPQFNVNTKDDYQGWWEHYGERLISEMGLFDFSGDIESDDWGGYVRVNSNYGYFYHETDGLNDNNCPESIYILSNIKRIIEDSTIRENTCNPWRVFGDYIKEKIG
jgi:hypothetical protein